MVAKMYISCGLTDENYLRKNVIAMQYLKLCLVNTR